ncbi:hypothetical protein NDI39_31090 [Microcoleus sp. ZQ-A2]|nr:hypothetical protein [Microcoleus sp. FACHB-1]
MRSLIAAAQHSRGSLGRVPDAICASLRDATRTQQRNALAGWVDHGWVRMRSRSNPHSY